MKSMVVGGGWVEVEIKSLIFHLDELDIRDLVSLLTRTLFDLKNNERANPGREQGALDFTNRKGDDDHEGSRN